MRIITLLAPVVLNDETNAVALVECNDGFDNADGEDTLIDMSDPGCTSATDTSEGNSRRDDPSRPAVLR